MLAEVCETMHQIYLKEDANIQSKDKSKDQQHQSDDKKEENKNNKNVKLNLEDCNINK